MKLSLNITSDELLQILRALEFKRSLTIKTHTPMFPSDEALLHKIDTAYHFVKSKEGEQFVDFPNGTQRST